MAENQGEKINIEKLDAIDSYFECVTACSLSDESIECTTECIETHLKKDGKDVIN